MEFLAVGTAVKSASGGGWRTPKGRPFTSELSGQDFWTLVRTGHMPVALRWACCVYHVAHQSDAGQCPLPNVGCETSSLPQYTQAFRNERPSSWP